MMTSADLLFASTQMTELFSAANQIRQMLRVEAALARAQATAGVIPAGASAAITAACSTLEVDSNDIYRDAARAGTVVIPLVAALTEAVDEEARGYVHWGTTSQDIVDTAMTLIIRDGLALMIVVTGHAGNAAAELVREHRASVMTARTLLQHAGPITFGLKAAHWLSLLARQIVRLGRVRDENLFIQLGGSTGALSPLGDAGTKVSKLLADDLALKIPPLPWHTDRTVLIEIGSAIGTSATAMGKIAQDVVLLSQTEVAEVKQASGPGKGASSAMPHKKNPSDATAALTAARLCLGELSTLLSVSIHEHERAIGGWQAEWVLLPQLFGFAAGAGERVADMLANLEVDSAKMRANLDLTQGRVFSEALVTRLARELGRDRAFRLVARLTERSLQGKVPLLEVASSDEEVRQLLGEASLEEVFDPSRYLGSSESFIQAALAEFGAISSREAPRP